MREVIEDCHAGRNYDAGMHTMIAMGSDKM
jgi:hypothetical protein